jgi:glycerophosphoryl diester phosphodiesterase
VELESRCTDLRWLVSSFRLATVNMVRRLSHDIRTAWLTYDLDAGLIAKTVASGHSAIHPYVDGLGAESVRAAHSTGLVVNTWTCDDADRMRQLIAWGVDGICTNVPDVACAVRDEALRP